MLCAPIRMIAPHMFNTPALLYPSLISHLPPSPPNSPWLCGPCWSPTLHTHTLMTLFLGSPDDSLPWVTVMLVVASDQL